MPDEPIATYQLTLPGGEVLVLDQTLWGQVVTVHEARLGPARYPLDLPEATRELRLLLGAVSLHGAWGCPADDPLWGQLRQELQDVIERLYGPQGPW